MDNLKEKLQRTQRQLAGLKEKSKLLERQYEDARGREQHSSELVMELLERQRELNVMLNRANIMLNRTQEALALTSVEFNEIAKALPEPKKKEFADRVSRINELFKKTGIQDAEIDALDSSNLRPEQEESLDGDELKRESEHVFPRASSVWNRPGPREAPRIEAEVVDDGPTPDPEPSLCSDEVIASARESEPTAAAIEVDEDDFEEPEQRKKSWWQWIAG